MELDLECPRLRTSTRSGMSSSNHTLSFQCGSGPAAWNASSLASKGGALGPASCERRAESRVSTAVSDDPSGDDAQARGLPCAVLTDPGVGRARLDHDIDVAQRLNAAEPLRDALQADRRLPRGPAFHELLAGCAHPTGPCATSPKSTTNLPMNGA